MESFSISLLLVLVCGKREATVMAPPTVCDSGVSPCLHSCSAFLHRHFKLRSPDSHPLWPFTHSQQQTSPWDCSPIPALELPATVLELSLCTGYVGQQQELLTPVSVPPPNGCKSSPAHSPSPPLSFVLPSFIWIYIFLSGGQGLLATLSWYSARYSLSKVYS